MFQKLFLTAQKKRSDALNAMKKTQLFTKNGFWKNQEKPQNITIFWCFWLKLGIFQGYLSERLFWAIKNCFRTIFLIFHQKGGGLFWFRGDQNLRQGEDGVEK